MHLMTAFGALPIVPSLVLSYSAFWNKIKVLLATAPLGLSQRERWYTNTLIKREREKNRTEAHTVACLDLGAEV